MRALRKVGVPYTDADIAGAEAAVTGKTEQDALIAYLQVLGRCTARTRRASARPKKHGVQHGSSLRYVTVVSFAVFLGIVAWAMSRGQAPGL